MPILDIVTIPNPILKQVSLPVEKIDYKIKNLVANMRETMLSSSHCVGIAGDGGNLDKEGTERRTGRRT